MTTISPHTLLQKTPVNAAQRESPPQPAAAAKIDTSNSNGTGSDTVTISLAAKVKQQQRPAERLDKQLAEAKKAQARERISDLKKRLEALKRLLAQFGERAAKPLLQQLKQLSGELKAAAKELKAAGGNDDTLTTNTPALQLSVNTKSDVAAPYIAEPLLSATTSDIKSEATQTEVAPYALWQEKLPDPAKQQHLADKKQLNTLTDELAGFYNLLRLMLQRKQPDPEQKKQQEAIEEDLQQIRKIATKLSTETSLPVTGVQERIDKLGN